MTIIKAINIAKEKQSNTNSIASGRKIYFGNGFSSAPIKNNQLKRDIFQPSTSSIKESDKASSTANLDKLALESPEKFIAEFVNEKTLKEAMEKNPNIEKILKENGLSAEFELKNVTSIIKSHLIPVSRISQEIYLKRGNKSKKNQTHLAQAALLHDIGKAFIPSKILNKPAGLTPDERKIVDLHSRLSYEILKTTPLHPDVAEFALEHHNHKKRFKHTEVNQALMAADIYSALREDRSYREGKTHDEAVNTMHHMVAYGELDDEYIGYISPR